MDRLLDYFNHHPWLAAFALAAAAAVLAYEMRLHTQGGPLRWSLQVHDELEEAFLDIGRDPASVRKTITNTVYLAPTQSEPPFIVAQTVVLVIFVVLGLLAVRRFHPVGVPA